MMRSRTVAPRELGDAVSLRDAAALDHGRLGEADGAGFEQLGELEGRAGVLPGGDVHARPFARHLLQLAQRLEVLRRVDGLLQPARPPFRMLNTTLGVAP